jgi:hypothetical protein
MEPIEIVLNDRLIVELQGLYNQVNEYWGEKSPSIVDTVIRAKAMLENSCWKQAADKRKRNQ